jgi:hypothetical protein
MKIRLVVATAAMVAVGGCAAQLQTISAVQMVDGQRVTYVVAQERNPVAGDLTVIDRYIVTVDGKLKLLATDAQGDVGIINGALRGAVKGAMIGAGKVGAAALLGEGRENDRGEHREGKRDR